MMKIKENSFNIDPEVLTVLQKDFSSECLQEIEILNIIKKFYTENNIVFDPHTAIGIGAVEKLNLSNVVILATAHPCKFPKAIQKAISKTENLPENLNHIFDREEKFDILSNNLEKVKEYVVNSI